MWLLTFLASGGEQCTTHEFSYSYMVLMCRVLGAMMYGGHVETCGSYSLVERALTCESYLVWKKTQGLFTCWGSSCVKVHSCVWTMFKRFFTCAKTVCEKHVRQMRGNNMCENAVQKMCVKSWVKTNVKRLFACDEKFTCGGDEQAKWNSSLFDILDQLVQLIYNLFSKKNPNDCLLRIR